MSHWFKRLHGSDWLYVGTMLMADLIEQLHGAIEKSRDGNPMHIVVCTWHEFVVVSDREFISNEQYMDYSCWTLTYRLMESSIGD